MQILIVEDDVRLARALAHILEENGYGTDVVHDGATGLAWAEVGRYDVIVLDVMLPKKDGFSVVADLRRTGVSTPVLLLTARDAVPDKITGLDSGADDYMTKPFAPAELLAHLRALTRRQGEVLFEKLSAGDLELNLESHDLSCGAKSIHLSYKEFCLAKVLIANAGAVVSKDLIIEKVWGVESTAEDNNVEAYVSFLRKKMKFLGSSARIETLRRAGYRFSVNAEEDSIMLKKLRLKFVALNMATVAVVLAVVFTAICVIDHQQSVARVQEALDAAVAHAGETAGGPFGGGDDLGGQAPAGTASEERDPARDRRQAGRVGPGNPRSRVLGEQRQRARGRADAHDSLARRWRACPSRRAASRRA